jgi:hypothetical protein
MDTLELPIVDPRPARRPQIASTPRNRWAPHDRPPAAGRVFVGLLGFGALLTTAALLLSDRAPGVLEAIFGDRARQIWERIDAGGRVDVAAPTDVTQTDFMVHVALWAVVAALAGVAVWTWRGLMIVVGVLAVTSLGVELAQGRYSSSRNVQASDAAANLAGLSLGAVAVGVCYLTWSIAASILRRLRSPRA